MEIKITVGKKSMKRLPAVIREAVELFFRYDVPKSVTVTSATETHIGGSWHDWNVPSAAIIRNGRIDELKRGCVYDVMINADAETKKFMDGEKVVLGENDIVVTGNTYPKPHVSVCFHPSKVAVSVVKIDDEEAVALRILSEINANRIGKIDRINRAIAAGFLNLAVLDRLRKRKMLTSKNTFTQFGKVVANNM